MKKALLLLVVLIATATQFSCKKVIEEVQKDKFINAMTSGEWYVDSFLEGAVSVTEQFADYNFKFSEDGTVTGTKNSQIVKGTWIGDIENYSINSNFPTGENPIVKLNGSWKITKTTEDSVHAEMNTPTGKMILHLKRK
ncbi:MAG: hypothetical protein J7497_11480, partial [Chitinophagaceae bacterium]|nr:hypothetical protein [Chitinophagaceae bacterium]